MSRGFHSNWWQGTAAERGGFPTASLAVPFFWYETDTRDTYQWDGVAWLSIDVGGSGAANQVAYWTGPSVLAGDAGMTYAPATDTLSVGNVIVPDLGYVGLGPAAGRLVFDNAVPDEARFEDCGYVGIENILYHIGDPDTYLLFSPDFAGFRIGNVDFLYMDEGAPNEFEVNPAGADIDFIVQAVGVAGALLVQGSDGQVTLGALGAGAVQSDAGGVISSGALPLTDLANYVQGSIIRGGVADWEAYAHPGTAGCALVSDATDIVWDLTPTWMGSHTFMQGMALLGNTGINIITVRGNVAKGAHVVDSVIGGACEYITFVTTTGAEEVVFNELAYDLDFRVEAVGHADALVVQGSDGQITFGALGAGAVQSSATGVISSGPLPLTDLADWTQGGLVYGDAAGWQDLAHPAAANHVLQSTAAEVGWSAQAVTFPAAGAVPVGTGGANQVAYWTAASALAGDAGLLVDAANDMYIVAAAGGIGNAVGTARLMFNSAGATNYAYFSGCNVGVGHLAPPGHFTVFDAAINTVAAYYGQYNYHRKMLGATDHDDSLYGIYSNLILNQVGGEIGHMIGLSLNTQLIAGSVGDAVNTRFLWGISNVVDLDGGTVTNDVFGMVFKIDQEAANTVTDSIYG
ncbi:MAG: hypothetical protein KKD44_28705, partial [Proteobacteria bacterium]|nr:hypothetical protein [Pseudomonadota bacterium]